MTNTQKLKFIAPFIILFSLLLLLWHELFYAKPNELPSALIGEPVPTFRLPEFFEPDKMFTEQQLLGHVSLLNVWASWCYACSLEQPMLMKIKEEYHVPIYSIDYKDNFDDAVKWLAKFGNPYSNIGNDSKGNVAIDFGVYGTPETFVVSPSGKILYRHVGALDQKSWDTVIYPLIQKYAGTT